MGKRLTQDEIVALRTSTPHATLADLFVIDGELPVDKREDFDAYLKHFAAPKREGEDNHLCDGWPCVACGAKHSFAWGIAHGSGHCTTCGWPATLYHFVKDRDGEELSTIRGVLLWAHPDDIDVRGAA